MLLYFFFFQAEDGIRDKLVTGVQTCALPISRDRGRARRHAGNEPRVAHRRHRRVAARPRDRAAGERGAVRVPWGGGELDGQPGLDRGRGGRDVHGGRSEEHTSELQSLAYLVCRLLLEKK